MLKTSLMRKVGSFATVIGMGATATSGVVAQDERQFLYCVSSPSAPGGKAYFTKVYPGTWDQSMDDEETYFEHVSKNMDDKVERGTTYCYALDTFDEAGLDREEGVTQIRKQGWEPVDVTWRP